MSRTITIKPLEGIGVSGALGITFIVLKLCGVINWSWVWVTCPFWGPLAVVVSMFVAFVAVCLLVLAFVGIGVFVLACFEK